MVGEFSRNICARVWFVAEGHSSVGTYPYRFASLPLYIWPYMKLSRVEPSHASAVSRRCMAFPTKCVFVPTYVILSIMRRYKEV